jgi:Uma2 family endonuclease
MSTPARTAAAPAAAPADYSIEVLTGPEFEGGVDPANPYRYGWRYVERRLPDGTVTFDQQPLTLIDVLHPHEDDQVPQNHPHARRRRYLVAAFESRLVDDPKAAVLEDLLISWDVPDLRPHGPDIAVVLGLRERREWSSFDVAEEGVRPSLIVELTSPSTASLDRSNKLDHYQVAEVAQYVLIDTTRWRGQERLRLLGYELVDGRYRTASLDTQGRLWLPSVRAWLGLRENEVICYDEAGQPVGDYLALAAALEQERALAEAQRRELEAERAARLAERAAAEARVLALEAELRRLRGEA